MNKTDEFRSRIILIWASYVLPGILVAILYDATPAGLIIGLATLPVLGLSLALRWQKPGSKNYLGGHFDAQVRVFKRTAIVLGLGLVLGGCAYLGFSQGGAAKQMLAGATAVLVLIAVAYITIASLLGLRHALIRVPVN